MMVRDQETDSIWAHSEGVSVSGPLKGTVLERVPCTSTTWEVWRRLHPDTRVLAWPDHPTHRDGRHGHGSRDRLGRPGIRAGRAFGLTPGELDGRLPENELILGVNHPAGDRAYPLDEIHRNGGIVHDRLGGEPVVVWSPYLEDPLTAGFQRDTDAGVLEFEIAGGEIRDAGTGSAWSPEGVCVEGELSGIRLPPLDAIFLKWHAWTAFHPDTGLYASDRRLCLDDLGDGSLPRLAAAVREDGFDVRVDRPVLRPLLPNLARGGLRVYVDDAPLLLWEFSDRRGAREYLAGREHLHRRGRFVVEEDPDRRFRDAAQLEPLPDDEMEWSGLLDEPSFLDAVDAGIEEARRVDDSAVREPGRAAESEPRVGKEGGEAEGTHGCPGLFDALDDAGYPVRRIRQLEYRRVRPGADNGYEVTIAGDPFLVYRFRRAADAASFADWHGHSLAAGPFVLRSDPPGQYKHAGLEAGRLPDDRVDWSVLLEDEEFAAALAEAVEAGRH